MYQEQVNQENSEEILKQFLYENRELEQLEDIIGEFNIFTALGIIDNEIRHSNFLCWLMNPSETHGFGDYFLKSFLKMATYQASFMKFEAPSIFEIDSWDLDESELIREWKNIDILIKNDDHKFVCLIENKVQTTEHDDQLNRYMQTLVREFPKYKRLFVYLTIEGERPRSNDNYLPMSYGDISKAIDQLLESKKDKVSAEIVSFIALSPFHFTLRFVCRQPVRKPEDCTSIR